MRYYKIILVNSSKLVGYADDNSFYYFDVKKNKMLRKHLALAQFIKCNEIFYRVRGLNNCSENVCKNYELVDVVEISEKEYLKINN